MTNIYQANEDFDFTKIHLANPIPYQGGSYFSKVLVGSNDDSLYIQSPKCKTKQGIVKTGKKRYTDLLFSNHNENFINYLNNLEENLQQTILKKQSLWFVNHDLDMEDIQNNFISPIKVYKGNNYLVRTNLNQPRTNIENAIPIFNESETVKQMDDITDKSEIICILEILGVKFTQKNFQVEINIKQIMLIENSPIFDNCLIKPSNYIQTEPPASCDDTLIKNETIVDSNTETIKTEKSENLINYIGDESVSNENNSEENINNDSNDSNVEITDSLENSLGLEELSEYQIEIDDPKKDSINLKKPVEIYMNLYLDARKKAKEAKKVALDAYLAAKNIKETYNLEIESDEDEEL
tara:strand:+ start:584 stop:1642 length:1059 start_codon:yes stop_codon:yes gene_type:complete